MLSGFVNSTESCAVCSPRRMIYDPSAALSSQNTRALSIPPVS